MWGCGLRPHPHIYYSLLLAGGFFSPLIYLPVGGVQKRLGLAND